MIKFFHRRKDAYPDQTGFETLLGGAGVGELPFVMIETVQCTNKMDNLILFLKVNNINESNHIRLVYMAFLKFLFNITCHCFPFLRG